MAKTKASRSAAAGKSKAKGRKRQKASHASADGAKVSDGFPEQKKDDEQHHAEGNAPSSGDDGTAGEAVAKKKVNSKRPRASKSAGKKAPKAKAKARSGRKKKADADENPFLQPPPPGQQCISLSTSGLEVTEPKPSVECEDDPTDADRDRDQEDPTRSKKSPVSSSSSSSTSSESQKSPEKSCLQFEKVGLSDDEVTEWVDKNGDVYVRHGDFDSVLDVELLLSLASSFLWRKNSFNQTLTQFRCNIVARDKLLQSLSFLNQAIKCCPSALNVCFCWLR